MKKCFITIKYHKPDFRANSKYRLLNPIKSKLGKHTLKTINTELGNKIKFNQWQSSNEVTKWFKNITNKNECTFTVFDIPELYLSVTEDLSKQAMIFAQNAGSIPPKSVDVKFHSRKTIVYHNDDPWVKNDTLLYRSHVIHFFNFSGTLLASEYLFSAPQGLFILVVLSPIPSICAAP